MGNRVDTLFSRLERLIPPPDAVGWHFTRLNLEAAAMGSGSFGVSTQDQQADIAESQLRLGAMLVRTDASPGVWDPNQAVSWKLDPVLDPGSSAFFLDVWGRTLSVPRIPGEPDLTYAKRIISAVSRSTTTNIGLAETIDAALGTSGTRVLDASQVLQILQFNAGFRMNSGRRFNNTGQAKSLWCSFIVQTAAQISDTDYPKFLDIVNSRKAAGTRLLGIQVGSTLAPLISAPSIIPKGSTFTASAVLQAPGVTAYNWAVTGGTILSGQGTSTISILAGSVDILNIAVSATQNAVQTPTATRNVILSDTGISSSVAVAFAGDGPFTATAPAGYSYTWKMTGGYIIGATNQRTVTFSMGEANQMATLTCTFANGTSMQTQIKIIPYTSTATASTPSLAWGEQANLDLQLGWEYDLVSMSANRPCWVRIYNTAADRAADAARAPKADPANTTNIVWEGFFTPDILTILDAPDVKGVNGDTPRGLTAYLSVVNQDTVSGPVTLSITRTETRTSGAF